MFFKNKLMCGAKTESLCAGELPSHLTWRKSPYAPAVMRNAALPLSALLSKRFQRTFHNKSGQKQLWESLRFCLVVLKDFMCDMFTLHAVLVKLLWLKSQRDCGEHVIPSLNAEMLFV